MNKRSWFFKKVSLVSCLLLMVQLVFGASFVVNPVGAQVMDSPRIDVEKTAVSNSCEEAEITLKIIATGTPFQERKPIDVIFIIDRSSSMAGEYLVNVKTAVNNFIDQMDFSSGDPDRVGVISYAGHTSTSSLVKYALGSSMTSAKNAVNDIEAKGGTCIECGLRTAYDMLNGSNEQFVILLSDGVANIKDPGYSDDDVTNKSYVCNYGMSEMNCPIVASECINNAVDWGANIKNDHATTIYSIGYRLDDIDVPIGECDNSGQTSFLAEQTLKNISSNPVGYYYSGDPDNINSVFDEIAYRINNIAGYDTKIIEVLPAGVTYDSMISGNAPSSISGQTITWEFGNMSIGDTKEVKFLASTSASGHTGLIDVYPDTRVEYLDVYNQVNTVPFPETSLTIDSCNPVVATSTISGYKYQDFDNDISSTSDWLGVSDWTINLFDGDATTSTTTDSNGFFSFSNLVNGVYYLTEVITDKWKQLFAPVSEIEISGIDSIDNNFVNYFPYCGNDIVDLGEECDDGNNDNGDKCDENCNIEENNGGDEWCGDGILQTSRGEECDDGNQDNTDACSNDCLIQEYCGDGECNNGETCSTCSEDCGSCSSGGGSTPLCILRGDCGNTYTPDPVEEVTEEVAVLGEEGSPILTITKSVNPGTANPGDTLNYSILITNNGSLEAFNVEVVDELPDGLEYLENESTIFSWSLGDIPIGESRDINYRVRVAGNTDAGVYTNTAILSADNHDNAMAEADVEVIIPVVLAETGMDFGELAFLLIFSSMSIIVGRKLSLESLA